jgi:hypothetical protein
MILCISTSADLKVIIIYCELYTAKCISTQLKFGLDIEIAVLICVYHQSKLFVTKKRVLMLAKRVKIECAVYKNISYLSVFLALRYNLSEA